MPLNVSQVDALAVVAERMAPLGASIGPDPTRLLAACGLDPTPEHVAAMLVGAYLGAIAASAMVGGRVPSADHARQGLAAANVVCAQAWRKVRPS